MNLIIKLSTHKRAVRVKINKEIYYDIQTIVPNTYNKWFGKELLTEEEFNNKYKQIIMKKL
jgi:hypothetical protein